jgi:preprotein translocase subunit SecG
MFLTVFLYVMIFIVALLLITLIMIQPSKSGGMGAAFGGIGESVFGGKAGSHLTKSTVVMTAIFFVVALILAAVIGHRDDSGKSSSVMDRVREKAAAAEVAAPAIETPAAEAPAPASQQRTSASTPQLLRYISRIRAL